MTGIGRDGGPSIICFMIAPRCSLDSRPRCRLLSSSESSAGRWPAGLVPRPCVASAPTAPAAPRGPGASARARSISGVADSRNTIMAVVAVLMSPVRVRSASCGSLPNAVASANPLSDSPMSDIESLNRSDSVANSAPSTVPNSRARSLASSNPSIIGSICVPARPSSAIAACVRIAALVVPSNAIITRLNISSGPRVLTSSIEIPSASNPRVAVCSPSIASAWARLRNWTPFASWSMEVALLLAWRLISWRNTTSTVVRFASFARWSFASMTLAVNPVNAFASRAT